MRLIFADTGYWVTLLMLSDSLHSKASEVSQRIHLSRIITSEMVLTEVLNDLGSRGQRYRMSAAAFVENMQAEGKVRIVPQTHELFDAALALFKDRSDKAWSLTDCSSMVICRQEDITDMLAYDRHFMQAGYIALLRDSD